MRLYSNPVKSYNHNMFHERRYHWPYIHYIALSVERSTLMDNISLYSYLCSQHGMIPLCGAQLHKTVDIEGQPLTADLQSGRREDLLAFRYNIICL